MDIRISAGDITTYSPWGSLALFYGNGPHARGLIRLGTLEAGSAAKLADMAGEITASRRTPRPTTTRPSPSAPGPTNQHSPG